jgi:hypothetical protein
MSEGVIPARRLVEYGHSRLDAGLTDLPALSQSRNPHQSPENDQNGDHVADAAAEQAYTEQHDPGLPPLNPSSERSSLRSTPSTKCLI